MSAWEIIAGLLSIGLLAYLFTVLMRAEDFS